MTEIRAETKNGEEHFPINGKKPIQNGYPVANPENGGYFCREPSASFRVSESLWDLNEEVQRKKLGIAKENGKIKT
jgi:hypothetical protein